VKSAKRPQLRRLQLIDQELRKGRFPTIEGLAETLEVNSRTVRRDIEFLRTAWNAPIGFSRTRNGWHYTDNTFTLSGQQISRDQMLAMFIAEQSLAQNQTSPIAPIHSRAIEALSASAPELASEVRETAEQTHSFRQTTIPLESTEIFATLTRHLLSSEQIEVSYWTASSNQTTIRVIDPWHVASINGTWYLFGWCHLRTELRMFAITRIQSIRSTGELFDRPLDFSIDETIKGGFQMVSEPHAEVRDIVIRCDVDVAKYVREKRWHPTQTIEEHSDGTLVVYWRLNSTIEVSRWIQSWGEGIEVLEPSDLRQLVYERAQAMAMNNAPKNERSATTRKPR
jgi:predicted DNA-binding transcriptional regulator YafY